jgi:tetratricopeptide (TPR) repeat protein
VDTSFNKYFNEAMDAFSKKDFQEALQKFAKAGQIDPKQYLCFENMGLCYYSMGDYARAIQMFDKVIATGLSMDGKSEFFKGACLIATGKISAACSFLQRANEKKYPEAPRLLKTYCK